MKSLWNKIIGAVRRHEALVWQQSINYPLFSIGFFATLVVWVMPLAPLLVLVGIVLVSMTSYGGILAAAAFAFWLGLGLMFLFYFGLWYFGACSACFALMLHQSSVWAEQRLNLLHERAIGAPA